MTQTEKKVEKAEERMEELHRDAVDRFLDDGNFDPTDWMNNHDADEYVRLREIVEGE